MNRPIEFRVWDTTVNPPIMRYHGDGLSCRGDIVVPIYENTGDNIIVVMQYTGLQDIQGKKIYEGDIVICRFQMDWDDEREYEVIYLVKWCVVHTGFRGFTKEMVEKGYSGQGMPTPIKIIGNLFENPELLK